MPHLPSLSGGCAYEQIGFTAGTTTGTTLTTAASADTYGSWSQLSSAIAYTWEYLTLHLFANNSQQRYTVDIGIGAASSEWVLAQNLPFYGEQTTYAAGSNWHLPLHVPKGSRVSMRARSGSGSADTLAAYITGYTRGPTEAPGYARMKALQSTTTCFGVSVDPTAQNSKTSWVQVNSSTSELYRALMVLPGNMGDIDKTTTVTQLFDIGLGGAGSETMIVQELPLQHSSLGIEHASNQGLPCVPMLIPPSSRLAVRVQSNLATASDRTTDFYVYGFQ